jgi:ANTAR domain
MTVIPGPRPPKQHDRPSGSHDRGRSARLAPAPPIPGTGGERTPVSLVRTSGGWSVVGPGEAVPVAGLLEGMSLADLVAEELGGVLEPDRTARRSARGTRDNATDIDPTAARIAALERTVGQLEHALAARVSTERAIGVLAERHGLSPRAAFEGLRRGARSSGRPVHELAREVLADLVVDGAPDAVVLTVAPAPPAGPDHDRAAERRR